MSGSKTENDILSTVPGLGDDTQSTTSSDVGTHTDDGSSTTGGFKEATRDPAGDGQQPSGTPGESGGANAGASGRDGRERRLQQNAEGDLVDPFTGQVAVSGGVARRVYNNMQRVQQDNKTLRGQLQQLQQQSGQTNEVTALAKSLNLTAQAQIAGMTIVSDYAKDPVRTIGYLVSDAKARGIDLTPVLGAGGNGIDMAALKQMVDEAVSPFHRDRQAVEQQQRVMHEARRELDGFLDRYPDAHDNLGVLTELMTMNEQQTGQRLGLSDAYALMLRWASQNGLDATKPLRPQVDARMTGRGQPQASQPRMQQRAPLPFGRENGTNGTAPAGRTSFDENSSYDDIIGSAMREAGLIQ